MILYGRNAAMNRSVTNDVTNDITNCVTNDVTHDVTNDVTHDVTNDGILTPVQSMAKLIEMDLEKKTRKKKKIRSR